MNIKKNFSIFAFVTYLLMPHAASALTKAKQFTLDNGLKVIYMELNNLPIVKVNLSLRGGSIWELPEKAGVTSITMEMLDQGTANRSALDIAKKLDFVGASLSAAAGRDFSSVSLSVLSHDFDLGMDILSDVVLHPSFPEKEMERVKKETLSAIEKKKEDPHSIAGEKLDKIIYGSSSSNYARPLEGYSETVKVLTRKDVFRFYKKAFRPSLTTIVVVGDVKEAVVREKLGKLFGSWKETEAIKMPKPKIQSYTPQNVKIEKDLTQTTIMLGHPGMTRDNPDYYSNYVMNYIMGGGGFSSRMMKNVRDNYGLVYTVYSYFMARYYGGAFSVFAQTKNKTKEQALNLIKEEIARMQESPVKQSELEDAKSYIIGSFPLKLDTTDKIASYLAYINQYHLGLDYFKTFPEKIKQVTLEDVKKAAQKYLHPNSLSTVLVGGKS